MNYNVVFFFGNLLLSYIYTTLLPSSLLNEKKYISWKIIAYTLVCCLVMCYTNNLDTSTEAIVIVIVDFLMIKSIFKKGYIISIIISVIVYYIIFLFNETIQILFYQFFNVNILYLQYYPESVARIYLTLFVTLLFISLLIHRNSFFNEMKEYRFESKNIRIVTVYVVLTLILMSRLIYLIKSGPILCSKYNFGVLLYILFGLVYFVYLLQIKEFIKSKNDYATIHNYIANVEKVANQLKKQEHEHNNQLVAIKAMALDINSKEIVDFIDKIVKNKIKNKIPANIGLDKIRDPILKSLLMHKINSAVGFNIKTEVFIRTEIPVLNISPKEITNIVGIIMDNAIEATTDTNEKYISVLIDEDSDEINITIANTYKSVNKLYETGSSTKGSFRGNGLSILTEIEEENDRIKINTELTEDLFIQDIFIKQ